ncbi:hypothetical protein OIE66_19320 [Nonomuraea sp. NBC_01738]|uniref:hypothetical protein n=1 Tax=Nonomuraea sp. NBC_01738 TaxID=2976003 RepID=UPI002E107D47|nr:hypothetical protein OIE66_19320 [Nonomuraea sp. NBC_01738]
MNLAPYVEFLRRELAVAAESGGDDMRVLAERLTSPLESATRLALLEALSAAADEITRDLAPGSVDVRLRGRDADFVVTPPPVPPSYAEDVAPPAPRAAAAQEGVEEGGTIRVALRVPEHLKPRIDEAAARDGLSVNAWLVRAVGAALDPAPQPSRTARRRDDPPYGHHYTGWVR